MLHILINFFKVMFQLKENVERVSFTKMLEKGLTLIDPKKKIIELVIIVLSEKTNRHTKSPDTLLTYTLVQIFTNV